MELENRCVCCGEIIPEGRQVCLHCEIIENVIDGLYDRCVVAEKGECIDD